MTLLFAQSPHVTLFLAPHADPDAQLSALRGMRSQNVSAIVRRLLGLLCVGADPFRQDRFVWHVGFNLDTNGDSYRVSLACGAVVLELVRSASLPRSLPHQNGGDRQLATLDA